MHIYLPHLTRRTCPQQHRLIPLTTLGVPYKSASSCCAIISMTDLGTVWRNRGKSQKFLRIDRFGTSRRRRMWRSTKHAKERDFLSCSITAVVDGSFFEYDFKYTVHPLFWHGATACSVVRAGCNLSWYNRSLRSVTWILMLELACNSLCSLSHEHFAFSARLRQSIPRTYWWWKEKKEAFRISNYESICTIGL